MSVNISSAGTMKTYNYPEISMEAPAFLDVKKYDLKDEFPEHGCCFNVGSNTVSVLVLHAKFPDQ